MEEITNPTETSDALKEEPAVEVPSASTEVEAPETKEEPIHVEEVVEAPKKATRSSKSSPKEKQSKESIEAAIKEKLSKRSDEGEVDPFVPSTQLQNEVKQVAQEAGFHLTRGTEAGAALMARARRRPHS